MTSKRGQSRCSLMCLVLVILIPACDVRSSNPLSDPATAKVDESLVGKWETKPKDGLDDGFLLFEKKVPAGFPEGVLKMTMKGRVDFVFCTQVKGRSYANVCLVQSEKMMDWEKLRAKGFLIYRYSIKDDVLLVECMEKKAAETAVNNGKLAGVIQRDRLLIPGSVSLTDTSDNVADFVTSADARFNEVRTLVRVK